MKACLGDAEVVVRGFLKASGRKQFTSSRTLMSQTKTGVRFPMTSE